MSAVLDRLKSAVRPVRDEVRRRGRRVAAHMTAAQLQRRNERVQDAVVGDAPAVVSLTSFGSRIETVAYAIESIGRGTIRPSRLILWLDEERRLASLPPALERLRARGLEVLPTVDYGPHKKYFPYASSLDQHHLPLVTADDDVIYPRWWLARLLATYEAHPDQVSCYRGNVVVTEGDRLAPYNSWPRCRTTEPSVGHMATGVSGVLYPPALVDQMRARGTGFLDRCPRADDVWLHWVALRAGVPVGQVTPRPRQFRAVPGTQKMSLTAYNVEAGGNDLQIAAVYSATDVQRLQRAAALRSSATPR